MSPVLGEALALRPGIPVLDRDPDTLQVGLTPPLVVRLPRRAEIVALLHHLRCGRAPDSPTPMAAAALEALRAADLLVVPPADLSSLELAPAQAQFGDDAVRRARQRADHRVGIVGDPPTQTQLTGLLESAGLIRGDDDATIWLVVAAGPVARSVIDPLQRAGLPHLVVSGGDGGRRLGPFVEPGHTACLRCVDAHEAVADPRRPFLLEQAALADDGTTPVDPVLDQLVLSWAVRDLARYAEGDEPSTWSATVDIGPLAAPTPTRWLRHPHCGCSWDALLDYP